MYIHLEHEIIEISSFAISFPQDIAIDRIGLPFDMLFCV